MSHPLPRNVRYDRRAGTIVVQFSNGSAFVVPARALQGLADASETEIAEVELLGRSGLDWKSLDLDHEINRLMTPISAFATPDLRGTRMQWAALASLA